LSDTPGCDIFNHSVLQAMLFYQGIDRKMRNIVPENKTLHCCQL